MTIKEHIHRVKKKKIKDIIIGIIFLGFLVFFSFSMRGYFASLSFTLLLVFCILTLIRFYYDKIEITDEKIIITRYFRTEEIYWRNISRLEPKLTGFLLSDSSGDARIFVSGEIINLWKFIKIINEKRNDLIRPTKAVFHENPIIAWVVGIAGSFIVYYSVRLTIGDPVNILNIIIGLLIGLAFIFVAIFSLKQFSFAGDRLVVKTLVRTRVIQSKEIDFSSMSYMSLLIISENGYTVSVERIWEGMPSFMLSFKYWLSSNPGNIHETMQDI